MKRDTRSALHEAAHATVAWRFGYPVDVVCLTDHGGYAGHQPGTDPLPRAIIAMAGHAADMKWHDRDADLVPAVDHYSVLSCGFAGRSLPTILALARGTVEEHAVDIQRVGKELETRDLAYDDLEELLGELGDSDLIGRKPLRFVFWVFELLGASPGDELDDLFPGSGVVSRCWGEFSRTSAMAPNDEHLGSTRATCRSEQLVTGRAP